MPSATRSSGGGAKITQEFGIGAQFGGKYFCHDVRVVGPRHFENAVGIGVKLLGGPPDQGQDHRRRCVPRSAERNPARYRPSRRPVTCRTRS